MQIFVLLLKALAFIYKNSWKLGDIMCFLSYCCFLLFLGFVPREFARWKVNNLALERKDFFNLPLPMTPEFIHNIRLLGRRPSLQQIMENLIKKYGTHFLLSATLGGECSVFFLKAGSIKPTN